MAIMLPVVFFWPRPTQEELKARAAEAARKQELAELEAASKREETIAPLRLHFFLNGIESARVEPDGYSVTVYVTKNQYQSIAFPDRKDFIEGAGKLWCPKYGGPLSSLSISDIRSGERLGRYWCGTEAVSVQ